MPGTRKLGRKTDHRMSMLRGMTTLLLDKGRIETTLHRAKEMRAITDKMITLGKQNDLSAKRAAMAFITREDVVKKLFDQVAPLYTERNGGYTRVLKLGPRRGDAAEMAIIELVDADKVYKISTGAETKGKASKKAAKEDPEKKTDSKNKEKSED